MENIKNKAIEIGLFKDIQNSLKVNLPKKNDFKTKKTVDFTNTLFKNKSESKGKNENKNDNKKKIQISTNANFYKKKNNDMNIKDENSSKKQYKLNQSTKQLKIHSDKKGINPKFRKEIKEENNKTQRNNYNKINLIIKVLNL